MLLLLLFSFYPANDFVVAFCQTACTRK